MKNKKLRFIGIIPNIFCYFMLVAASIFVFVNLEGLQETNQLTIWLIWLLLLLFVCLFGSYRILKWIREGKL